MAKSDLVKVIDQRNPSEYVTYTGMTPSAPGSGQIKHNLTQNRSLPDQHPISAVTNLREELDVRVLGAPDGEPTHIPLWEAVDKIVSSILVQLNGKIGVDVDDPKYLLDVGGLARVAGIIFGQLVNGPYMTEDAGALNLSNPDFVTQIGARTLHLEGLSELALTSWGSSVVVELTDANAANTFSIMLTVLPDGFYFLYNGGVIAVLDNTGKLWLTNTQIGDLSAYRSLHMDALVSRQNEE